MVTAFTGNTAVLHANEDWDSQSYVSLINHIMFDYHLFLRSELPQLSEYICKIKRNHGNTKKELFELHRLFHVLKHELEQHLFIEEEQVFPLIVEFEKRKSPDALRQAKQAVERLESEPHALNKLLGEIRRLTSDYSLLNNSSETIALTYGMMENLESKLMNHIHMENTVLFSRVRNN